MRFREIFLLDAGRRITRLLALTVLTWLLVAGLAPSAHAGLIGPYSINNFVLTDPTASSLLDSDGLTWLTFTGPNDGSGDPSQADLLVIAAASGLVQFDYDYSSLDGAPWDFGGYLKNGAFTLFANPTGTISFSISQGQTFGFRLGTLDNTGEPAILSVSNFTAPQSSTVPEPGSVMLLSGLIAMGAYGLRRRGSRAIKPIALTCAIIGLFSHGVSAQTQNFYAGSTLTGQLTRTAVTNATQLASLFSISGGGALGGEIPKGTKLHNPMITSRFSTLSLPTISSLTVTSPATAGTHYLGLTHFDQRNANHGNQFSVEPGNPSVAVGNGFVLEGVNNAIQVYNTSGVALLPKVLSSNELFGVSPAIDRNTDLNGVYPTDMKVFYDQTLNRFFVVERAQDYDIFGNPQLTSKLYIAVTQTGDPTGAYNVYTMNTTNGAQAGCPCLADYPQLGADQSGFYITVNEYSTFTGQFIDARLLAISKVSLAADSITPTLVGFQIARTTGYEFTIFPATTPPGASYYVAGGGLEYFVSTTSTQSSSSTFALWALTNTASLNNAQPSMTLIEAFIPSPSYFAQDVATQKPGPLPYGSQTFPGFLPFIDGGDTRVQSVVYSGGRLYVALGSQVQDQNGKFLVGGAWAILSPTFRSNQLAAPILKSGYLMVTGNHILRPAFAVTPAGKGAIVFTLVGPDYYPSTAFVPISLTATGTAAQLIGPGAFPEDGFTGYPDDNGLARWGDSSSAVAAADGSIWMSAEFIPNAPRTDFANWGTSIVRFLP